MSHGKARGMLEEEHKHADARNCCSVIQDDSRDAASSSSPRHPLTPPGKAPTGGQASLSVSPKRTYAQTTKSSLYDNDKSGIVEMYFQAQTRLCHEQGWPTAYVHVNGRTITALLDSGAKVNLISFGMLKHLGYKHEDMQPTQMRIRGITDQDLIPMGEINLPLELMGRSVPDGFIVLEETSFPADILLSFKFMRFYGIVLNLRREIIHYDDSENWEPHKLYFAQMSASKKRTNSVSGNHGLIKNCNNLINYYHSDDSHDFYAEADKEHTFLRM